MRENLDKGCVFFSCLEEGFNEVMMMDKCVWYFFKGLLKVLLCNYLKMINGKSVC